MGSFLSGRCESTVNDGADSEYSVGKAAGLGHRLVSCFPEAEVGPSIMRGKCTVPSGPLNRQRRMSVWKRDLDGGVQLALLATPLVTFISLNTPWREHSRRCVERVGEKWLNV